MYWKWNLLSDDGSCTLEESLTSSGVSGRRRREWARWLLIDLICCGLAWSTFIRSRAPRLCPLLFEEVLDSFHRRYSSDRGGCVNLRGIGVLKVMIADSENKQCLIAMRDNRTYPSLNNAMRNNVHST